MIFFLIRFIITAAVVVATAHIIPGLHVKDLTDLIIFGVIVGLVNAIIRPIITLLTLPITIFTLGIFLIVINAFTYWLAAEISYGVHISTWQGAFWGGLIVWLTGLITNRLIWQDMY